MIFAKINVLKIGLHPNRNMEIEPLIPEAHLPTNIDNNCSLAVVISDQVLVVLFCFMSGEKSIFDLSELFVSPTHD